MPRAPPPPSPSRSWACRLAAVGLAAADEHAHGARAAAAARDRGDPGSIVPQRTADPNGVLQYKTDNPGLFPILDGLQLFDVYSSVWFSAIYILLFISLIGCVIPRTKHHFNALRARRRARPCACRAWTTTPRRSASSPGPGCRGGRRRRRARPGPAAQGRLPRRALRHRRDGEAARDGIRVGRTRLRP
jgi:hypothetical protein